MLTTKQIKQRYFNKKRAVAPIVKCSCGCGGELKSVDNYGRPQRYINGHNGRKYEDPQQHKREWNHRNRESRYAYKTMRAHWHKSRMIKEAGGKCTRCPVTYTGKNASLFDFHHRDPKKKKFNINQGAFHGFNLAAIQKEAKKCDLICANCHRLEHSAEY